METNIALNDEDIALVQITIEQWERIRDAYTISVGEGLRVYAHETGACRQQKRICRMREEHDLENGNTMATMSICRTCPIVIMTRRTCFWNIEHEWPHDIEETLNESLLAQDFSKGIITFLRDRVLQNE